MLKRLIWFFLGVGLAGLVVVKGRELARKATPAGLADTVGTRSKKVHSSVEAFVAEVREGMREREAELREALGRDAEAMSAVVPTRADH